MYAQTAASEQNIIIFMWTTSIHITISTSLKGIQEKKSFTEGKAIPKR
jgi:hypothetical protein